MGETNAQGADVSLAPMGESVVCRVYSAPYRIPPPHWYKLQTNKTSPQSTRMTCGLHEYTWVSSDSSV